MASTLSPQQKCLVAWLKDAHAMEHAQVNTLSRHADDVKSDPEMQQRMRQHIEETRRQADLVKQCLARYDEAPSAVKNAVGAVTGLVSGLGTAVANDEKVKNCLADYASEQFEIACYRSLAAAARDVGDQQTEQVCKQILSEEERMARYLETNIEKVTNHHLQTVHD